MHFEFSRPSKGKIIVITIFKKSTTDLGTFPRENGTEVIFFVEISVMK